MRYAASSGPTGRFSAGTWVVPVESRAGAPVRSDRKSTRLNSSHANISYAVFCLKKKEHTSELQSRQYIVCRLLLEKKNRELWEIIDGVLQEVTAVLVTHRASAGVEQGVRDGSAL